jgi:hypothetical protein
MIAAPAQPAPADIIYRAGPETQIAAAAAVVAGPVSDYSKRVTEATEPVADAIELRWVASGRVASPQVLKGKLAPAPLTFNRVEASMLVDPEPSQLPWEAAYGDVTPGGRVVLFLEKVEPPTVARAVPSGGGEQDLVGLVKDVVAIHAIASAGDRQKQWLAYLNSSPTDEGRKAAWRTLVAEPIAWPDLEPIVGPFLKNPARSPGARAFAFGILAWAVTQGKWQDHHTAVADALAKALIAEPDAGVAIQHLLALGQIVSYCAADEFRDQRKPLRNAAVSGINSRPDAARPGGPPARPDQDKTYRELRLRILAR